MFCSITFLITHAFAFEKVYLGTVGMLRRMEAILYFRFPHV